MKKLTAFIIILLISRAVMALPFTTTTGTEYLRVAQKGAADPAELARMVLLAIQNNNFEDLNAIILDDQTLGQLKKSSSEDVKALLEKSTTTDIKNGLKNNYQEIMQQGISRTINWANVEITETKVGKGSPTSPMVQPITITLTNKENQAVQILLETAKLNNRYFLFQRMALKP